MKDGDSHCQHNCVFYYMEQDYVSVNNDTGVEKFCEVDNFNGCFIKFIYFYNDDNSELMVHFEKDMKCYYGTSCKLLIY